jgi:hypothetical protein
MQRADVLKNAGEIGAIDRFLAILNRHRYQSLGVADATLPGNIWPR